MGPSALRTETPLVDAFQQFLHHLGTSKPSPHTIRGYRFDLRGIARALLPHVADRRDIADLSIGDVDRSTLTAAFADWAAPRAPATVRRAHSAWRQFIAWLLTHGILDHDPMHGIRKPKKPNIGRVRSITTEDVARLLAAAKEPPPASAAAGPSGTLRWSPSSLPLGFASPS